LLEVRIAQHQPVVGVPQHEGFRYGLDGVAQPQIRRHRAFDQALLLGDVDGDADQMQAGVASCLASSQRARSHSHRPSV
jgi:hypothetical protein